MTGATVSAAGRARPVGARVELRGVSKAFPGRRAQVEALGPLDLAVADGEFVVLVGPSGCGKTTLLNLVAGFEFPSAGEVLFDGRSVAGPGPTTVLPSKRTLPADGNSNPATRFSKVVLPQPEGPTRTTNSPSATARSSGPSASTCARRPGNAFDTPRSSTRGRAGRARPAAETVAVVMAAALRACWRRPRAAAVLVAPAPG